MKILILSDLHISNKRYGSNDNDIDLSIRNKMLLQEIDELKKIEPNLIIINGDLIDNVYKINSNLLIFIYSYLKKLSSIAPIIINIGNHDILLNKNIDEEKQSLKLLNIDKSILSIFEKKPNISVTEEPISINISNNTNFIFIPFNKGYNTKSFIKQIDNLLKNTNSKDNNIIFTHNNFYEIAKDFVPNTKQSELDENEYIVLDKCLEFLNTNYPNTKIINGHYHFKYSYKNTYYQIGTYPISYISKIKFNKKSFEKKIKHNNDVGTYMIMDINGKIHLDYDYFNNSINFIEITSKQLINNFDYLYSTITNYSNKKFNIKIKDLDKLNNKQIKEFNKIIDTIKTIKNVLSIDFDLLSIMNLTNEINKNFLEQENLDDDTKNDFNMDLSNKENILKFVKQFFTKENKLLLEEYKQYKNEIFKLLEQVEF